MGALADKPNYFIEKIWTGLDPEFDYYSFRDEYFEKFSSYWDGAWTDDTETCFPKKVHTIRAGDRWRAGMKIHPVINNRTKHRLQFAPTMICTSVQEIEFKRFEPHIDKVFIYINGSLIRDENILKYLAVSDGFDTLTDFLTYFNADFKGQIIHWTNLKY